MLPTGFFAVAVGILCLVLLAVVSMRRDRFRRRRARDGGAMLPLGDHGDDGGYGDGK